MKQHRPRVSDDNYQRVMSNLTGRFGENETFDNALWLLLAEYESLKRDAEKDDGVIKLLRAELNNTTESLADEKKKSKEQALAQLLLLAFFLIWWFVL